MRGTLHLYDIITDDEGEYSCKAKTDRDSTEARIVLEFV